MNNQPELISATDLSDEDVADFLESAGFDGDCPICKKNDWAAVVQNEYGEPSIPLRPAKGYPLPPASIPVILMVCSSCGFIAQIAQQKALEWKQNKGASNG